MEAIAGLHMEARLTISSGGVNRAYQAMAWHLSVNRRYYET
jgi:hypothetical protein